MKIITDLLNEIQQRRSGVETAVLRGVNSLDEYKSLTGEIRGLSFAQLCVSDLVRKLENGDDNE
jgi:hypothetical protein